MIFLFVFVFAFCDAKPGYSESSYSGNDIGKGTTSTGTGGNSYGYAGSFSGAGGLPPGNVASLAPFIPQFDFSSFFEQLNRQHQEFIRHGGGIHSYSYASSSFGANANAQAAHAQLQTLAQVPSNAVSVTGASGVSGTAADSHGTDGYEGGFGLGNRGGFVGGYGGGFTGPDGNSFSFSGPLGEATGAALSSGSIGPGGGHQMVAVFPENPNAPNVNTRFGGSSGGGEGFKSVVSSSQSVSTNIDGKPQTFREASTTINDNGKITTYTAHNP
ncbi:putative lysozyme-like protein isoform X1 [Euwallacea fornicatus]|uniref:putative lysozyme-like protein isoform X1 n=1 Tax=Euwallacea fornicatus TaxID=995702 RepID=UPI00338E3EAD